MSTRDGKRLPPLEVPSYPETYQRFRDWYNEGQELPGYIYGYGHQYLKYLFLNDKYGTDRELAKHDGTVMALSGQHGWAIYQTILARRGLK